MPLDEDGQPVPWAFPIGARVKGAGFNGGVVWEARHPYSVLIKRVNGGLIMSTTTDLYLDDAPEPMARNPMPDHVGTSLEPVAAVEAATVPAVEPLAVVDVPRVQGKGKKRAVDPNQGSLF
jgi:hypothetical protein